MHMTDALLSPAVGGSLWAASAVTAAVAARRARFDLDDTRAPLMGVVGAFVFAAQMVNVAIPGTGSSGHLGGGLLLAILLGPSAGFLTIFAILFVQALLFADGGLLALGANAFNLGVLPCFAAYPLLYRPLARRLGERGETLAAVVAAVVGLQVGALGVVSETVASGITELPFRTFALAMLPIHLPVGIVEGLLTAAVVRIVKRARPDVLGGPAAAAPVRPRRLAAGFLAAGLVTAGVVSWLASARPDGLEWSVANVAGGEPQRNGRLHAVLAEAQRRLAALPDYALPKRAGESPGASRAETSLAGLAGAAATLLLVAGVGLALRRGRKRAEPPATG